MITVLLSGGLGNQLFQYATGRMLSLKHHTGLTLDLTFVNSKLQLDQLATYRRYELDVFDLPVTKTDLLVKGKYLYPISKMEHWLRKFILKIKYNYLLEDDSGFDEHILKAPDNSYIEGFFQSEKYFAGISEVLRKDLEFKKPLSGRNLEMAGEIQQTNSVSVHFRRGDYFRLNKNLQKHGVATNEYYEKAIASMVEKVSHPDFYIFTDEPEWVRKNFRIGFPYKIAEFNQSPDTAYLDMQLMSLCRHNIICNSTFSWWGAWLNRNPGKIIIAPKQWFTDLSINATHILPDSWIKL